MNTVMNDGMSVTACVFTLRLPRLRLHCRSCMAWDEISGTLYTVNHKDLEENGRNVLQHVRNI